MRKVAVFVLLSVGLLVAGAVQAASSNANLETLTVRANGGATLVPAFLPDHTQYEVSLPSDIRAIQVRGSAWVGASKLKINDQPVARRVRHLEHESRAAGPLCRHRADSGRSRGDARVALQAGEALNRQGRQGSL